MLFLDVLSLLLFLFLDPLGVVVVGIILYYPALLLIGSF
jgi:hypothetical protein